MKINAKEIAEKIHARGLESSTKHIEDVIFEALMNAFSPSLDEWAEEVLERLEELEHPEPKTKAEYDERYGLDKE